MLTQFWWVQNLSGWDQYTYLSSLLGNNPEFLPGIQDSVFITWGGKGSEDGTSIYRDSLMLAEPQRDKQTLQRQGDVELKILKSKNAVETEPRKRQK